MNYVPRQVTSDLPRCLPAVDDELLRNIERRADEPDFWSSRSRDRTDSAHCIFQYPAMMVPVVQRRLLRAVLDVQPCIGSLYDPFVGSGTSLVSGMHFGLSVYGNDVNPLAVLISRVRTAKRVEFTIGAISQGVVRRARRSRSERIETKMPNLQKWFTADVADELSRLRRAIRYEDDLWVRRFLWTTLAETVRLTSNDRTSTYKLHARPSEEVDRRQLSPIKVFEDLSIQNAESFSEFRATLRTQNTVVNGVYRSRAEVGLADTRYLSPDVLSYAPFDLVMTSPPYGDNHTTVTYGQHSYLPLNWIDLRDIDERADASALQTTQEIDRRGLGGRAKLDPNAEAALLAASPILAKFACTLPPTPADGRRRLIQFYVDFHKSLRAIVKLVNSNGYMIWTVGNRSIGGKQVPTDTVLDELLSGLGCKTVTTLSRTIHHKRMPDRNASSATMREERILLVRRKRAICDGQ